MPVHFFELAATGARPSGPKCSSDQEARQGRSYRAPDCGGLRCPHRTLWKGSVVDERGTEIYKAPVKDGREAADLNFRRHRLQAALVEGVVLRHLRSASCQNYNPR
jgi:hypothetical protein